MRTVILISAVMICAGIQAAAGKNYIPIVSPEDNMTIAKVLFLAFVVSGLMDVAEFIKKMKRR